MRWSHSPLTKPALLGASALLLVGGCSSDRVLLDQNTAERDLAESEEQRFTPDDEHASSPQSFVAWDHSSPGAQERVTLNVQGGVLNQVLADAFPDYTAVAVDQGVSLDEELSVRANDQPREVFFRQLTGMTGYDFRVKGNVIEVASTATREWNIAELADNIESSFSAGGAQGGGTSSGGGSGSTGGASGSSGGTGGGGGSNSITGEVKVDAWQYLLSSAESMLTGTSAMTSARGTMSGGSEGEGGEEGESSGGGDSAVGNSTITGVRHLGLVRAEGPPRRIAMVDSWFESLKDSASKQVDLTMRAFEVTLDESRGQGVDWEALGEFGSTSLEAGFSAVSATRPDAGSPFSIGGGFDNESSIDASAMISFLSQYGETELLNQPRVRAKNGFPAMVRVGDEISYVSDMEQAQDLNGNVTVTPTLSRLTLGIEMHVLPRILSDGRIQMTVTPTLTNLQGYSEFSAGAADATFQSPDVAIEELTTTVIAEPGETVRLGGLISKQINHARKGLPNRGEEPGWFAALFESLENDLSRRELVLSIKPEIVGG